MKKKICLMLSLLMVISSAVGCGKSKVEDNSTEQVVDGTSTVKDVTIVGSGTHCVGDIVTFDDIAVINEDISTVKNKAILSETGELIESIKTDEEGSFAATIIVEFTDGGGYSGIYNYVVEAGNSFDGLVSDAASLELPSGGYLTTVVFNDEVEDKNLLNYVYTIDDTGYDVVGIESNSDDTDNIEIRHWSDSVDMLQEDYIAYFTNGIKDMLWSEESIKNSSEDIINKYNGYITDVYSDILNVGEKELCAELSTIGETNGEVLKLYKHNIIAMYSRFTGNVSDDVVYPIFTIEDENTGDVIKVNLRSFDYKFQEACNAVLYGLVSSGINPIVEDTFETYDDFYAVLKDNFSMEEVTVYDVDSITAVITDHVFAGKYEKPVNEIIDEAGEPQEEQTEETEQVVSNVKKTYASLHPEIYKWPESSTKYRRWCYVMHDGVTYLQTIIDSNGKVTESGKEGDMSIGDGDSSYFTDSDNNSGNSGNNGSNTSGGSDNGDTSNGSGNESANDNNSNGGSNSNGKEPEYEENTVVFKTDTTNYYISNSKKRSVNLDVITATDKSAKMTYNSKIYYMEAVDEDRVNMYLSTLAIGTPDDMIDSTQYQTSNGNNIYTTIGTIVPHYIEYTDTANRTKKIAYMVSYKIGSDVIVVYSNEYITSEEDLVMLLKNMISK